MQNNRENIWKMCIYASGLHYLISFYFFFLLFHEHFLKQLCFACKNIANSDVT